MMDFAQAWDRAVVGTELIVSDGRPEPPQQTPAWRMWRSHNFTGSVLAKIDGPPRVLRIEFETEAATIAYDVSEAVAHTFTLAAPDLADKQRIKLAELATMRWEKTQWFIYDGVTAWAEPAVKNLTGKITALKTRIDRGEVDPRTDWKLCEGEFRNWNLIQLEDFGLAVDAYVQACFTHEATLAYQIATADETTIDAIDITTGWPTA